MRFRVLEAPTPVSRQMGRVETHLSRVLRATPRGSSDERLLRRFDPGFDRDVAIGVQKGKR